MLGELLTQIDLMRTRLHQLGQELGINHPEVLALSRDLDVLIVQYYKSANLQ